MLYLLCIIKVVSQVYQLSTPDTLNLYHDCMLYGQANAFRAYAAVRRGSIHITVTNPIPDFAECETGVFLNLLTHKRFTSLLTETYVVKCLWEKKVLHFKSFHIPLNLSVFQFGSLTFLVKVTRFLDSPCKEM